VPPAVVIETAPVVAPGITIATKVFPSLETGMAETPPIVNEVGLPKLFPEIVTNVPTAPLVGVIEFIVGGGVTIYTQAAPAPLLSLNPPTIAVLPSALMDTELP